MNADPLNTRIAEIEALATAVADWKPDLPWSEARYVHPGTLAAIVGSDGLPDSPVAAFCDALTPSVVLDLLAALRQAREALDRIAEQQQKTLAMIESNGFVFDSIGREPGNWQHLAFTIYTDLCEVETIARAAAAAGQEDE